MRFRPGESCLKNNNVAGLRGTTVVPRPPLTYARMCTCISTRMGTCTHRHTYPPSHPSHTLESGRRGIGLGMFPAICPGEAGSHRSSGTQCYLETAGKQRGPAALTCQPGLGPHTRAPAGYTSLSLGSIAHIAHGSGAPTLGPQLALPSWEALEPLGIEF